MAVNIFGSSGKSSNSVNKRYVDQKFTTLSTNLALKVNKFGDTVMGDLKISMSDDKIRTFGVTDISSAKSVSLLVGDTFNQIRYNFGSPLKIGALYGTKFTCPVGITCKMGGFNDARAVFFQNISMNSNSITDLHDPAVEQDATTKRYVDTRCVKNSVGLIPTLVSNASNGYIVSASTEINDSTAAFSVFNSTGEWLSEVHENFWIQVKCPEAVRIHKFAIQGVQSGTILNWKLQARNDGMEWSNLFDNIIDGNTAIIDQSFNIYISDSQIKYSCYRIWIGNAVGELPGLSYWQLFAVDELV